MTIMTKEEVRAWCKEIADKINADPVLLKAFNRAYCYPANTYRDHRGLRITDDDMLDKFQESGKSEQDWEAFFGKELWQLNGFAYAILDSYIIGRDWAIEVNARKDKNHEPR